nr:heparinase II/III family protein [uncultured Roseateles sp.]
MLSLIASSVLLVACGGGGSGGPDLSAAAISPSDPASANILDASNPESMASAPELAASQLSETGSGASAHILASTKGTDLSGAPKQSPSTALPGALSPNPPTAQALALKPSSSAKVDAGKTNPLNQPSSSTAIDANQKLNASTPVLVSPGVSVLAIEQQGGTAVQANTSPAASLVSPSQVAMATKEAGTATISALGLRLNGDGLPGYLSTTCAKKTFSDFIERVKPELKRVRPVDCRILSDSQALFSWAQPADKSPATTWAFTLKRADGSTVASKAVTPPRLLLDQTLAAGDYNWTVSYKTATGATVTSDARRFTVPAGLANVKLPNGLAFANTVAAKSRPRLLPSGSNFADIASAAQSGEYKAAYAALIKEADLSLKEAAPTEPVLRSRSSFASPTDYNAWVAGVRELCTAEQRRIEALAFAYRMTNNQRYASAAIQHMLALAAWDPLGEVSEAKQPLASRDIHLALSTGLDLLWDKLTDAQRNTIATHLQARLSSVMDSIRKINESPYLSFENTSVYFGLRSLMLMVGTPGFPSGAAWLQEAWDAYSTIIQDKGDQDGSAGGSVAYAWWDMYDHARTFAMVKAVAGVDLTQRAFGKNFGTYLLAMTAPDVDQFNAFGDSVETQTLYKNYAFDSIRLYAAVSGQPEHQWYWRARAENIQFAGVYLSPLHFMMLGLPGKPVAPAAPDKNAWAFGDVGIVASHSKTADKNRSSFFFKSGTFGSYNHEHADQNSFSLISKGRNLLISAGYYDYYNSPHHNNVTRSTRYKNAVTFDGGVGQAGSDSRLSGFTIPVQTMQTRGQLLNYQEGKDFVASTGDATLAYRNLDLSNYTYTPLLTEAYRSFVHVKSKGVFVIYDWLSSETAKRWEWNYHALAAFTDKAGSIVVNNAPALACIDHYGVNGKFSQTSAWDVAPSVAKPTQYHGRYTADAPSKQAAMVTVIREDCQPTLAISVNVNGSVAKVSVEGQNFEFDRKSVTVPKL